MVAPTNAPLPPVEPGLMKMCGVGSDGPNTLPPLKLKRARPSQKLSKLNAAPCNVGVLRGSTLRKPCVDRDRVGQRRCRDPAPAP